MPIKQRSMNGLLGAFRLFSPIHRALFYIYVVSGFILQGYALPKPQVIELLNRNGHKVDIKFDFFLDIGDTWDLRNRDLVVRTLDEA